MEQVALALGVIALGSAFLIQKNVDKKVSIALVVAGIGLLVLSFTLLRRSGGATVAVAGTSYPVADFEDAAAALCAAQDQAGEDFRAAQVTFLDRAHTPLHVIATAVGDEDRAQAAALLEAKQQVEQGIIDRVDGDELAAHLGELARETRQSLEIMEIPVPPC